MGINCLQIFRDAFHVFCCWQWLQWQVHKDSLNPGIQTEVACCDVGLDLDPVIWLNTAPEQHLYNKRRQSPQTGAATSGPRSQPSRLTVPLLINSAGSPPRNSCLEYMVETLRQGFISWSMSPTLTGFFIVEKKEGGLSAALQVDNFCQTLPEECIQPYVDSGSWQVQFSTTLGRCVYGVMPYRWYGLVNGPSTFQAWKMCLLLSI